MYCSRRSSVSLSSSNTNSRTMRTASLNSRSSWHPRWRSTHSVVLYAALTRAIPHSRSVSRSWWRRSSRALCTSPTQDVIPMKAVADGRQAPRMSKRCVSSTKTLPERISSPLRINPYRPLRYGNSDSGRTSRRGSRPSLLGGGSGTDCPGAPRLGTCSFPGPEPTCAPGAWCG